jgi:hypothetical protein
MVALATEEQAVSNWAARIVAQIPAPDTVDEFLRLLGERKCVFQVASTLFTLAPDDPRLVPAVDALVRDETVHDSTRRELAQRLHLLVTGERWAVPRGGPGRVVGSNMEQRQCADAGGRPGRAACPMHLPAPDD